MRGKLRVHLVAFLFGCFLVGIAHAADSITMTTM
jgi:hypothetical protein